MASVGSLVCFTGRLRPHISRLGTVSGAQTLATSSISSICRWQSWPKRPAISIFMNVSNDRPAVPSQQAHLSALDAISVTRAKYVSREAVLQVL